MKEKLEELCRRFDELTARMGDPEIYADPTVFNGAVGHGGPGPDFIRRARSFLLLGH